VKALVVDQWKRGNLILDDGGLASQRKGDVLPWRAIPTGAV